MIARLAVDCFRGEVAHVGLEWAVVGCGEMACGGFICFEAVEIAGWAVTFDHYVLASGRAFEGVFVAEVSDFAADPAFFECRECGIYR